MKKSVKKLISLVLLSLFCFMNITSAYAATPEVVNYDRFANAVQNDEYLTDVQYNIIETENGAFESGSFNSMGQTYSYEYATNANDQIITAKFYQQDKTKSTEMVMDEFVINGRTKELTRNGQVIDLES